MAQQTINVGTAPNDGTGDTLKASFTKTNQNFTELYNAGAPQCGRLSYVSTISLKFAPYKGDLIRINGVVYQIPAAGIAGLASTSSVFVDGVAAQPLLVGVTYLVCAFNNGGTITADFRTTLTHAPSSTAGNVGVEVPTGLDSRSVIGMVWINTGPTFVDNPNIRGVINWFNRRNVVSAGASTGGANNANTTFAEISSGCRAYWITWGDEAVRFSLIGTQRNNANGGVITDITIDGSTAILVTTGVALDVGGGSWYPAAGAMDIMVAEGFHYSSPMGYIINVGGGIWYVSHAVTVRG